MLASSRNKPPFPLPPSLNLYKWSLTKFLCSKNPSTNSYSQFFTVPTVPVLPQLQLFIKLSILLTPQHFVETLSLLPGSSHSLSSVFLAPEHISIPLASQSQTFCLHKSQIPAYHNHRLSQKLCYNLLQFLKVAVLFFCCFPIPPPFLHKNISTLKSGNIFSLLLLWVRSHWRAWKEKVCSRYSPNTKFRTNFVQCRRNLSRIQPLVNK